MAKVSNRGDKIGVFIYQGVDRISSELMIEMNQAAAWLFPTVQTPVLMSINVNGDIVGGNVKRYGCDTYLDNPDNQPVQAMAQFTASTTGLARQIRVSGTHIYTNDYSDSHWHQKITLSASNARMRYALVDNYLFLTNGIDPFMYYDGTYFYAIVNDYASCTVSNGGSSVASNATTIPVSAITNSATSLSNFNPNGGFLHVVVGGVSEYIKYIGTTVNGSNQITAFTNCTRGYNNSTPQTIPDGATITTYYGTPPTTPKYLAQWQGRVYTTNQNGSVNALFMSSAELSVWTDSINYFQLTDVNGVALSNGNTFTYLDNDGDQPMGLIVLDSNLIVGKVHHVYYILPTTTGQPGQIVQVPTQYGIRSQESFINYMVAGWWIDEMGEYTYTGSVPQLMSNNVKDLVYGVNQSNWPATCASYWDNKIMTSVGATTEDQRFAVVGTPETYNNIVLILDYLTNQWYPYQYPFTINCYGDPNMIDSNGNLQCFFGDTSGNTYIMDRNTYSDAGYPINAWIQLRYMYYSSPDKKKHYGPIWPISEEGQNATVTYSLLGEDGKTPFAQQVGIPKTLGKVTLGDIGIQYYAIAPRFGEDSTGRWTFSGFIQNVDYRTIS